MFGEDVEAAGAAAAGGAPGGAVRLNKGTYPDGDRVRVRRQPQAFRGFRAKLIDYGKGLAEAAFAFVGSGPGSRGIRGASLSREENEARAVRRARTRLRQLVLAAGLDHLLTLTYRKNVTDFERASSDLARFERKVRTTYPTFQYVAVPEPQKRGAWHWHLAVKGWQDVAFLRAAWLSIVGEGNVDVSPPRHGAQDRRLSIVRYMSKYLAKGLGEGLALNRHRFRSSRGIDVPVQFVQLPVRTKDRALEVTCELVAGVAGMVGFHFINEEYGSGVVFSWT